MSRTLLLVVCFQLRKQIWIHKRDEPILPNLECWLFYYSTETKLKVLFKYIKFGIALLVPIKSLPFSEMSAHPEFTLQLLKFSGFNCVHILKLNWNGIEWFDEIKPQTDSIIQCLNLIRLLLSCKNLFWQWR
jgi:hypothetical protein